jgi:hypothetical protein
MTNVGGLIPPERILCDVRSMITDPLKHAGNEESTGDSGDEHPVPVT